MNSQRTYYKIGNKEAIETSKMGQRFLARLTDLLIALLPGFLIISIYQFVATNGVSEASITNVMQKLVDGGIALDNISSADLFNGLLVAQYNWVIMMGWSISIIGLISVFFVFPLLNKKNFGQTIGKWLFKITPLYLSDNQTKSLILRETLMIAPVILTFIFLMAGGYSVGLWFSKYSQILNLTMSDSTGTNLIADRFVEIQSGIPSTYSIFDFMLNIGNNTQVLNNSRVTLAASASSGGILLTSEIFKILVSINWLVLTIFITANKKGKSPIDMASKTAIVDLKTVTSVTEAENTFIRTNNMNH